jgi:hypothetical protein
MTIASPSGSRATISIRPQGLRFGSSSITTSPAASRRQIAHVTTSQLADLFPEQFTARPVLRAVRAASRAPTPTDAPW